MVKKICLLFCLTSLFSQILQAQEEYEPGTITTVDNDTIEGYILYEIDSKMSNEIYFRSSESTASKIYKPSQLKSLQFNDGRYFKTVRPDPAVKTESDKVMVKRMMQGKIDVYVHRFKNEVRPNFHLENNENQESVYLIYPRSKLINLGEKLYNYSNKRYLGQINLIKSGVDETNQKALKYKEKSILENIEKYNNQFREAYTQKKYDEKIRFSIDLSGGFRMLGREGVAFRAAVFRNKHEAERTDRFSVIRGVSYQHWSNKDKPIDDYSGSGEDNIEWNFISVLPYGVKYAFSSSTIQPYVYAAGGAGVLFATDRDYKQNEYQGNTSRIVPAPVLNLGAGLRMKAGSNFVFAEITPSGKGMLFLNAGFSF